MIKNNDIFSKRIVIYFIAMTILVNIYSYFKPKTIIYENKELEERFVSKFYDNIKNNYKENNVVIGIKKIDAFKNVYEISFLERNTHKIDKLFFDVSFFNLNDGLKYEIKNIKIKELNSGFFMDKNNILKLMNASNEERIFIKFNKNVIDIKMQQNQMLLKYVENENDQIISYFILIIMFMYAIYSIICVVKENNRIKIN